VWKDNRRRHAEKINTWDVLHKFSSDYKVIFVGDATMSPYEITYNGGSVEHWNEEAGAIWLDRVTQIYEHMVWLNPTAERHWDNNPSIDIIRQLVKDRMYPMTLEGLDKAMKERFAKIADDSGLELEIKDFWYFPPTPFDKRLVAGVRDGAAMFGYPAMEIVSGAGHDAQMLARVCPTSMIFVPSVNGLSHNLAELTHAADLQAGADVLLQMIVDLAGVAS
jgi:hypothetical protein